MSCGCKGKRRAAEQPAEHKQLTEKIGLLALLLDGLTDTQIAEELSKHGFALNELWELSILVDSALRAARKLRRSEETKPPNGEHRCGSCRCK